jgi:uncharacterized membrane protein
MKILITLMIFVFTHSSLANDKEKYKEAYEALEALGEITSLRCQFTEPFFEIAVALRSHDMDRVEDSLVLLPSNDLNDFSLAKLFSVTIDKKINKQGEEVLTFFLKNSKDMILRATKNNQGSDGMSDITYTYDAVYTLDGFTSYGGCEIEKYNAVDLLPRRSLFHQFLDWLRS